ASEYVNCEAQENFGHGFDLESANNITIIGCTSSTNGIGGGSSASNPNDQSLASDITMYGFRIYNSINIQLIGCLGEDFRKNLYNAQTQKSTLIVDASSNNIMAFITESNQSATSINNSLTSNITSVGKQ